MRPSRSDAKMEEDQEYGPRAAQRKDLRARREGTPVQPCVLIAAIVRTALRRAKPFDLSPRARSWPARSRMPASRLARPLASRSARAGASTKTRSAPSATPVGDDERPAGVRHRWGKFARTALAEVRAGKISSVCRSVGAGGAKLDGRRPASQEARSTGSRRLQRFGEPPPQA